MDTMGAERFDTIVIGGGQAGLSAGYYLRQSGRDFVVLDSGERIGDAWRTRYDSLRLFTPRKYAGLPGGTFPKGSSAPTKDEMANYLESYAARFDIPVRLGVRGTRLDRMGDGYLVSTDRGMFEADHVVVATGAHKDPRTPAFASDLDPSILQLHSSEYRNPTQLRDGGVLVVGAGNSGGDIALELSSTHPTWLSGPDRGHVPVDIDTPIAHLVFKGIRFFGVHVLTLRTPLGRRAREKVKSHGDPLVRVKPKQLLAAGVRRVGKTVGTHDGRPVLEDGGVPEVANVIWCTGFRHDLSWIDLPIFDEAGEVVHDRGVVTSEPGLYFVGLVFQFSAASDVLPGVGRDARYVARQLEERAGRRVPVAA